MNREEILTLHAWIYAYGWLKTKRPALLTGAKGISDAPSDCWLCKTEVVCWGCTTENAIFHCQDYKLKHTSGTIPVPSNNQSDPHCTQRTMDSA